MFRKNKEVFYLSLMLPVSINTAEPRIMHIDMNSCFARVEQQAYPHLRGKPVVIAAYDKPYGIIISPSVEAKTFGIKVGMSVQEAQRMNNSIIVRTTDAPLVRDVHLKLRAIFNRYSPAVTPRSIDEAILDFHSIHNVTTDFIIQAARQIKKDIREEVGEFITCSVGIGTNRFLAKMGASLKKPDGLVVITSKNLQSIYHRLDLVDLYGVNERIKARLNVHGIFTPLQFLQADLPTLKVRVFKSIVGYYWYLRLRGWETDDVEHGRKSFGQQYALEKKTADPVELSALLMKLCEKMGTRLRRHGSAARGVHLGLSFITGEFWHKGKKFKTPMYATMDLYRNLQYLFNQRSSRAVVTRIMVSCFGLAPHESSQPGLFDIEENRWEKISESVDTANNKYGDFSVHAGSLLTLPRDVLPDRIGFGNVREL